MPKDIAIRCDGTGNEIGSNISDVLKLCRVLENTRKQRVCYTLRCLQHRPAEGVAALNAAGAGGVRPDHRL